MVEGLTLGLGLGLGLRLGLGLGLANRNSMVFFTSFATAQRQQS